MLGSHNSMTYLPLTGWSRLLRPWVRCQSLTLMEQYNAGVRYFDIRIRLVDGKWRFCHNNAILGGYGWNDVISVARKAGVYFRFILDIRRKPKDAENLKKVYIDYIRYCQFEAKIPIDSAIIMWEWHELCPTRKITQGEFHASVSAHWYEYIFGCKWFAKRRNHKAIQTLLSDYVADTCKGKEALLLDYVQYQ